MVLNFLAAAAIGGLAGGTISALNGGDFLKGAFSGVLFGGAGGLLGGAIAGSASGATATVLGKEISKNVLYQAIGGMAGGVMAGMQVANQTRAERQLMMQRERLAQNERLYRAEAEKQQREYEKVLNGLYTSKEKSLMKQLSQSRRREDANEAFMQYIDGGLDGNLSDVIGGFYGENELQQGFA